MWSGVERGEKEGVLRVATVKVLLARVGAVSASSEGDRRVAVRDQQSTWRSPVAGAEISFSNVPPLTHPQPPLPPLPLLSHPTHSRRTAVSDANTE